MPTFRADVTLYTSTDNFTLFASWENVANWDLISDPMVFDNSLGAQRSWLQESYTIQIFDENDALVDQSTNIPDPPENVTLPKSVSQTIVQVGKWSDFGPTIGGLKVLDPSKRYEITGPIIAEDDASIDHNNSVIYATSGILYNGIASFIPNHTIFKSSKTATIKGIYVQALGEGSQVFDMTGTGVEFFQCSDCLLNANTSLGSISNYGVATLDYGAAQNNLEGLTLEDIGVFASRNFGWDVNNLAPYYLKLKGSFNIFHLMGDGMYTNPGTEGIDLSELGSIITSGQISGGFAFTGTGDPVSDESVFEDPVWNVDAYGLTAIYSDLMAYGSVSKNASSTTVIPGVNMPVKISGASTYGDAIRTDDGGESNRIRHLGKFGKPYSFSGSVTIDNTFGSTDSVEVYIAVNGVAQAQTKNASRVGSFLQEKAIPITGTVFLNQNDYAEVWVANGTDATNLIISAYNYSAK